jgi:sulfur-carrier protein adenylyltransferase/sulfurtransferase
MAKIALPTPLRPYANKQSEVTVSGKTVGQALDELTAKHPELKKHLFGDDGKLRSFVNVYLNDEDIRYLKKSDTEVKDSDLISIIPSIAGGVDLTHEEIRRYSRHLIMPEVGMAGQKKLKAASVLLVGTGGLGSPAAMYLAAAGVGRIGLVDYDVVDESNLQRQVVHGQRSIGKRKVDSAKERMLDINPNVQVDTHDVLLNSDNALELFAKYDVIADGTDNFPTRYLVNDACTLLGKPNVYASIFRFEGQLSVFWAKEGPCYRCLYPEPPPPGLVPSCAEGGVLGILPGVVGVLQATETVKLILETGDSMVGRLMLFDALGMKFRELKLRKDPDCVLCGKSPTVTKLIDYQQFCGVPANDHEDAASSGGPEIAAKELATRLTRNNLKLVDVREPHEWDISRIEGAKLIPLRELPARMNELDTADEIVLYCKSGARSMKALKLLEGAGFRKLKNLKGGINAWSKEVDPKVPLY